MKRKEFIDELATASGISPEEAAVRAEHLSRLITDYLVDGDTVSIQGFGTFEVKKRKERLSVNPLTGKTWLIPPKWVPGFKPGPTLKEKIKQLMP